MMSKDSSDEKYFSPPPGQPSITEIYGKLLRATDCDDNTIRATAQDLYRYVTRDNDEDVERALWDVWNALFKEALASLIPATAGPSKTGDKEGTSGDTSSAKPGVSGTDVSTSGDSQTQAKQSVQDTTAATPKHDDNKTPTSSSLQSTKRSLIPDDAAHRRAFFMCPGIDRLVSLLQHMNTTHLGDIKLWDEKTPVWKGLPLFGSALREEWNVVGAPGESTYTLRLVITRFLTLLTSTSALDLDHFAIWSLREGLEESTPGSTLSGPLDKEEEARQFDMAVSEAALWLSECATPIWKQCASPGNVDKQTAQMTRPGKLFEGQPWYSVQRWEFWKQRVDKLLTQNAVQGDVKIRLQMAAKALRQAEQSSSSAT